jgi:hypothetical protein
MKSCFTPRFARNVIIAGEGRFVAKLHRPWPAWWQPWRATLFWPQTTSLSRFTKRDSFPNRTTGRAYHYRPPSQPIARWIKPECQGR